MASNVIGLANWRADLAMPGVHGVVGLESSMDAQLAGKPGKEVANTEQGNDSVVIPNSQRVLQAAVPGENVQLTIDADLQYEVQQMLTAAATSSGAKRGSAVVLDAKTGEVYALANDVTFNPNDHEHDHGHDQLGNPAITTPFEPGSVNKVVTMAAAIDEGLVTPTTVVDVPPFFQNGDKVVRDDWAHGDCKMTVTGIFAKSSNIGTDELAKQVGPQNYYAMLTKMGIGQKTGIELPGESPGYVPPMNKWSGVHVRQPAHRPGPVHDRAADGRHVPGHRQRRRARAAEDHQVRHQARRDRRAGQAARRRAGGQHAGGADGPHDDARRHPEGRAGPDGAAVTTRPCPATRSPARPAPASRSTRRAAATAAR